MTLRVLVVDDSIVFRRALGEALASIPGVEVVGSVANGRLGLQKVRELDPDVVTLDLEMPELDGLAVLTGLKQAGARAKVLVVSALTARGGQLTMRALELGAFDFITKPDARTAEESREYVRRELAQRLRLLAQQAEVRHILRGPAQARPRPAPAAARTAQPPSPAAPAPHDGAAALEAARRRYELVLIGSSTGGPQALGKLLPQLPGNLAAPVLIVQHMPPIFTASLANSLSEKCALRVREASDGEIAAPGTAYIAPGGRQMRIAKGPDGAPVLQITDDPPENNCRPSVDYLFRSVSLVFPGRAAAAILTGMGSDGTLGLRLLKRHGCFSLGQDEATSVVYGMARAAADAGVVDAVLPLEEIAGRLAAVAGVRR